MKATQCQERKLKTENCNLTAYNTVRPKPSSVDFVLPVGRSMKLNVWSATRRVGAGRGVIKYSRATLEKYYLPIAAHVDRRSESDFNTLYVA